MELHKVLPYTSTDFFLYMLYSVVFVWLCKTFLKKWIPFKASLFVVSLMYLVLLFPKPIHFIGLVIILFIVVLLLRKFYKKENILLPMLFLGLPIILMKFANILDSDNTAVNGFKNVVQIAGLSYIGFRVMGLYIDLRNSESKISFIDFFNFSAFTPTLLIGPLDRINRFNEDVEAGYQNLNGESIIEGIEKLAKGLLYKFIIAELIRRLVLSHLIDDGSVIYHTAYMFTYLFYLFFDFAGYSLLAIAYGKFLGINVPINFDRPFLALNPKEFWKKWHKSLGDWLNDYFFKPIFKYLTSNKISTSIRRQSIALFLTFLLMGFWNGFELHYVASGALFGLYSLVHNYYVYLCKKNKRDVFFGKLPADVVKYLSIGFMIILVAFAIYIFSGNLF